MGTSFSNFHDLHIITYFDCIPFLQVQMLTIFVLLAKFATVTLLIRNTVP